MVDVFKIKKGDTVKFRNGEVHTVTEAIISVSKGRREITICIERCGKEYCYGYEISGGLYYSDCRTESDRDIVEHVPGEYEPSAEWMAKWGYPDGTIWGRKDEEPAQDEMTMRDQFAMSAMSGLVGKRYSRYEDLARWSYDIADKMMKARKENN